MYSMHATYAYVFLSESQKNNNGVRIYIRLNRKVNRERKVVHRFGCHVWYEHRGCHVAVIVENRETGKVTNCN